MKAIADVEDEEEITEAILIPVKRAALNLETMRSAEGEKLAEDLLAKGETIKQILDKIAERLKEYKEIQVPYRSRSWTVRSNKE